MVDDDGWWERCGRCIWMEADVEQIKRERDRWMGYADVEAHSVTKLQDENTRLKKELDAATTAKVGPSDVMVDWESIAIEMELRKEECVAYAASVNARLDKALDAIRWEMDGCVGASTQAAFGAVECDECCGRGNCHLYQTYKELTP